MSKSMRWISLFSLGLLILIMLVPSLPAQDGVDDAPVQTDGEIELDLGDLDGFDFDLGVDPGSAGLGGENPKAEVFFTPEQVELMRVGDSITATLNVRIPDGHYAYLPGSEFGLPIAIVPREVDSSEQPVGIPDSEPADEWMKEGAGIEIETIILPEGEKKVNEFGDTDYVLHHDAEYEVTFTVDNATQLIKNEDAAAFHIRTQICNEETGTCYQPEIEQVLLKAGAIEGGSAFVAWVSRNWEALTAIANNPRKYLSEIIRTPGKMLPLLFLLGLLVFFTPCVLPLVPLTVSYIGSQTAGSPWRGFVNSVVYVMGMASVYVVLAIVSSSLLGLGAGELGTQWYLVIPLVILFVFFALSMFGFYEFKVPSFLMRKKDEAHGKRGSLGGMFSFGLFAGLVASPCTGPVVLFLLSFIPTIGADGASSAGLTADSSMLERRQFAAENPDGNTFVSIFEVLPDLSPWMVGLYLLVFTIGLGFLLILLGTFSTLQKYLPKTGFWSTAINYFFGVLMIVAIYFFLSPMLAGLGASPLAQAMIYGAIMLIVFGNYVAGLLKLGANYGFEGVSRGNRIAGIAMVVIGLGAATWGVLGWTAADDVNKDIRPGALYAAKIENYTELNRAVAIAGYTGHPVLLDFWAPWCKNCMIFGEALADPDNQLVQDAFEDVVVLKLNYDEIKDDNDDMLTDLGIEGLPFMAVTDYASREIRDFGFDGRGLDGVIGVAEEKLEEARAELEAWDPNGEGEPQYDQLPFEDLPDLDELREKWQQEGGETSARTEQPAPEPEPSLSLSALTVHPSFSVDTSVPVRPGAENATWIEYAGDLKHRVEQAGKQGYPVILDFWAPWCMTCNQWQAALQDPENALVREAFKDAVVLRADYDRIKQTDPLLLYDLEVEGLPMLLVTDSESGKIDDFGFDGRNLEPVISNAKEKLDAARVHLPQPETSNTLETPADPS